MIGYFNVGCFPYIKLIIAFRRILYIFKSLIFIIISKTDLRVSRNYSMFILFIKIFFLKYYFKKTYV